MSNIEIEGKVSKVMPKITGQSANGMWQKQEFIIKTSGEYPKEVCFSVWGDKVQEVSNLKIGQPLKVSFSPESREYNERWYTDLRAWRIVKVGGNVAPAPAQTNYEKDVNNAVESAPEPEQNDNLPF